MRCRSRCSGGADAPSALDLEALRQSLELRLEREEGPRMKALDLAGVERHRGALGQTSGQLAQHSEDAFGAREAQLAVQADDRAALAGLDRDGRHRDALVRLEQMHPET